MACTECADCASALRNGTIEVDWANKSVYFACWACNEITMRLIGTAPTDCEYCRQMAMALAKCKVGVHNGGRITVRCANCLTAHSMDMFPESESDRPRRTEDRGVHGMLTNAMADAATGRQIIEDARVISAFAAFMSLLDASQIRDIATWITGRDAVSNVVKPGRVTEFMDELVPLLSGSEKKSLRDWARCYLETQSLMERTRS